MQILLAVWCIIYHDAATYMLHTLGSSLVRLYESSISMTLLFKDRSFGIHTSDNNMNVHNVGMIFVSIESCKIC